jgi:chromosome segregation ATPase
MTITELQERINKAEETITKKNTLIEKRNKSIEKTMKKLRDLDYTSDDYDSLQSEMEEARAKDFNGTKFQEGYNYIYDLHTYYESIKDAHKAIEETKEKINRYSDMLKAEEAKNDFINNLPDNVKTFMDELEDSWNKYDMRRRDKILEMRHELYHMNSSSTEYKELHVKIQQKFGNNWYEDALLTDEQIKKDNKKAVRALILDFINRVKDRVGTITSFANLYLNRDNQGYAILNGKVEGTNGVARVESIYAGGYNIQKLHVRVLVK